MPNYILSGEGFDYYDTRLGNQFKIFTVEFFAENDKEARKRVKSEYLYYYITAHKKLFKEINIVE